MYGKTPAKSPAKPAAKPAPSPESQVKRMLFDTAHAETMNLGTDEYKDFRDALAEWNWELYALSMKPVTAELLKDYTVFFIGSPKGDRFTEEEIVEIMHFLRDGGAMCMISASGGDQYNNTNLNDIAEQLGFLFNGDFLAHEEDFEGDDFYDTICKGTGMNPLTMGVRSLYTGPTCTIKIVDPSGAKSLAYSHEPFPESRHVAVHGYYGLGRFFSAAVPMFRYIKRHDNKFFLQSVFFWLSQLRLDSEML
ncbi:MAG TPA: hypothetical protein VKK79_00495 [Candidatus Lokiarchaeia archaeon]|nr:hypothetical protein [Candidatus Lokiarchaeia archaeon]